MLLGERRREPNRGGWVPRIAIPENSGKAFDVGKDFVLGMGLPLTPVPGIRTLRTGFKEADLVDVFPTLRKLRRHGAVVVASFSLITYAPVASALPPGSTPREIELGEEAVEDIAKSVELLDDPERLAELQRILDEIAAQTPRSQIHYVPHLVDTPVINAFVLPGGFVYVTTGLLDAVESDDELAGVLAHEIAHNVNQHAIERMRSTPKGLGLLQLASIAALILGKSPEAAVLASTAANAITAAVVNGGTIEAEKEADAHGIAYLAKTKYNPTGFLTFMEKLASTSGKFYEEQLGIYQTHPLTRDRVRAAKTQLEKTGVPVLRRLVMKASVPESRSFEYEGRAATEILYEGERLLAVAGQDSARVSNIVESVRYVLDYELKDSQIKIVPTETGVSIEPWGGPSFSLTAEDGLVDGRGEAILAGELRTHLCGIVIAEQNRYRANDQFH